MAFADVGAQLQLRRAGPEEGALDRGLGRLRLRSSARARAPRAWSIATTSMDMPSVSDSRMTSGRFSLDFWPVGVRNWMPADPLLGRQVHLAHEGVHVLHQ